MSKIQKVKPKKHLGQHFLIDQNIARKIVASLTGHNNYLQLIEVGPGTGALTKYLLQDTKFELYLSEVDIESVNYLQTNFVELSGDRIIQEDFLSLDFNLLFSEQKVGVIGNFPYNISSQIFFKILKERQKVEEVVGMIQREVAERICSKEGSKVYGILSVLLQAYYDVELLFHVSENVFNPKPRVKSSVLRLKRNSTSQLDCDEEMFFKLVKMGFQQRRKTLWNAVKQLNLPSHIKENELFTRRAEQLSVSDFIELTNLISSYAV